MNPRNVCSERFWCIEERRGVVVRYLVDYDRRLYQLIVWQLRCLYVFIVAFHVVPV